ncbi:CBF/Mak21 family protein [Aphelenchoides bicaudatus]|nr:CBF/Mak21 family protein [Aphelenchoides bicaudatus]
MTKRKFLMKLSELKDGKFDPDVVDDFVKNHLHSSKHPELFADLLMKILKQHEHAAVPAFKGLLFLVLNGKFALENLYEEAYTLLRPSICYSDNVDLLTLVDKALTSPYIPKYILAAYAKRLSRLLLFAPVKSQILILAVLKNLFIHNKGVFEMMVNREDPQTFDSDPFDNEATIAESKAADSSLWELKALTNHWFIRVSDRANFIHGHRPEQRTPVTANEVMKLLERKFNENNSVLSKPLIDGRLKALEDLIVN